VLQRQQLKEHKERKVAFSQYHPQKKTSVVTHSGGGRALLCYKKSP
jgi:hypothetical protein